ncbi:MAG: family 1 encapsulin nanocompartment shell protein [Anaerolineae bacterium]
MSEYLMREDAPLTDTEWERLDDVVVSTARQLLVGRRLLELAGPHGAGLEVVPVGHGDDRRYLELQVIERSFMLLWREIQASRKAGVSLELGPAAQAAMACAREEDEMVFGGLLDAAAKSVEGGDWGEEDTALMDVVKATELLYSDGFVGPYAVVLSPDLYISTQRRVRGMGRLVGDLIENVAKGGLYRTPLLGEGQGLVLSLGAYNFDLVVGQDLITAYQGNEGLDHSFRVLETVALRIKRPGAICTL